MPPHVCDGVRPVQTRWRSPLHAQFSPYHGRRKFQESTLGGHGPKPASQVSASIVPRPCHPPSTAPLASFPATERKRHNATTSNRYDGGECHEGPKAVRKFNSTVSSAFLESVVKMEESRTGGEYGFRAVWSDDSDCAVDGVDPLPAAASIEVLFSLIVLFHCFAADACKGRSPHWPAPKYCHRM